MKKNFANELRLQHSFFQKSKIQQQQMSDFYIFFELQNHYWYYKIKIVKLIQHFFVTDLHQSFFNSSEYLRILFL